MILIIVPRMTLGTTEIELVTNIFHYRFNIIRYQVLRGIEYQLGSIALIGTPYEIVTNQK